MSHARKLAALLAAALFLLPVAGAQAKAEQQLLVTVGDSYATGYQSSSATKGANTKHSYSHQLVPLAKKRGYDLKLVNFGCGGATTVSMLKQTKPCPKRGLAVGGTGWGGKTQTAAAEAFLRKNRGKVALITVSISGNDVTACARTANPVPCVAAAVESIKQNVGQITKRLRKAAGPKARIVGITYPDVILGMWVGENANQDLAKLSVVAFQSLINPALKATYEAVDGRFVDVTAATGAYTPLEQTTTLAPYGTIPVAVAKVCELTFFCHHRDIHMNTQGYGIIADLIAKTLPKRK
jgi:lysophospholipase L1-like esterase